MADLTSRITVNPDQCGGRPCIRGLRVRVSDVLDLFALGLTGKEILKELPYLEPEDLQACLQHETRLTVLENVRRGVEDLDAGRYREYDAAGLRGLARKLVVNSAARVPRSPARAPKRKLSAK